MYVYMHACHTSHDMIRYQPYNHHEDVSVSVREIGAGYRGPLSLSLHASVRYQGFVC